MRLSKKLPTTFSPLFHFVVPMGGPNAPLGVEDSIPGVVDVIASQGGKSGLRFLDRAGRKVRW